MAKTGSCLCGHVTMTYDTEPAMKALCHCVDCQKISGSTYSTNMVIKDETFKWTGQTPKSFKKSADSGSAITSYFCGDCGCTLARVSESFPGMVIIKAGTVKGGLEDAKPDAELFAPERTSWAPKVAGTDDVQGMPS